MCSWCWGFMPVIERVRNDYDQRLKVELLLGGLRPGTEHPLPAAQRQQIIGHWHAVHRLTGQPFRFERAMPDGFIYDTEPASRAVVAVRSSVRMRPSLFFAQFNPPSTLSRETSPKPRCYPNWPSTWGLRRRPFWTHLNPSGPGYYAKSFSQGASVGRAWFSHVDRQQGDSYALISSGYCSFEELNQKNRQWSDA